MSWSANLVVHSIDQTSVCIQNAIYSESFNSTHFFKVQHVAYKHSLQHQYHAIDLFLWRVKQIRHFWFWDTILIFFLVLPYNTMCFYKEIANITIWGMHYIKHKNNVNCSTASTKLNLSRSVCMCGKHQSKIQPYKREWVGRVSNEHL